MKLVLAVVGGGGWSSMDILHVSPEGPGVTVCFITALYITIEWLPITVGLHVTSEMVMSLECLGALLAGKFALVRVG